MPTPAMERFDRSFRPPPAAEHVGDVDPNAMVRLTVVLKPAAPFRPESHSVGRGLTRDEFDKYHATADQVFNELEAFAKQHGMQLEQRDPAGNTAILTGKYGDAMRAFRPDHLGVYKRGNRHFVARSGHLFIPSHLADSIVAVLGFDQREAARLHFRIRPAAAAMTSYDPREIATHYGFPADVDGHGQTIGLIELGGGYDPEDVNAYFAEKGIQRTGTLEAVPVDGATNAPDGNPQGADGEVQLDIDVAGSVAKGANIAVYFGPNQGDGFYHAVRAAIHDKQRMPSVISISWGNPESLWSPMDMDAMDQLFQAAATLNITVAVASGDHGAVDRSPDSQPTTDFPASSPHALGCGGTSLPRGGIETAWNNHDGWATGGGFSGHFARPSYQTIHGGTGRGVPDVAGVADGYTGYNIRVDGQDTISGGTSAVAPLWAGLIALLNQKSGKRLGFINPALYANPNALTDITSGDNDGYAAGQGWDPPTGLGVPNGNVLATILK